ncbi:MAG: glycosyltransferase family 9 protein [Cyclobacteriaceae bacterium]
MHYLKKLFRGRNKLIIVKLDAIGDYILFRNYLEFIRKSDKYNNHHITLCGNRLWRNLAEEYDKEFIDSFIWMDIPRFSRSRAYRLWCVFRLKIHYYGEVISPTHSRRFYIEDDLVKKIRSGKKTGSQGDDFNISPNQKVLGDAYYTHIVTGTSNVLFEYEKNRVFIDKVLDEQTSYFDKPFIPVKSRKLNAVVVCPGAGAKFRQWSPCNFAVLCDKIVEEVAVDVVLCGSKSDKVHAGVIIERMKNKNNIYDRCGETTLIELVNLIASAKIVIANESSPVHIAVAVDTPAICLSNGNHFGRFNPYPPKMTKKVTTLYPPKLTERLESDYESLVSDYYRGSKEDINQISVLHVFKAFQSMEIR